MYRETFLIIVMNISLLSFLLVIKRWTLLILFFNYFVDKYVHQSIILIEYI